MCLLITFFNCHADSPLIVAANRDEWLKRPAKAMTVLQRNNPMVIGGQDMQANGTWLAINEHGVWAGLTNQPPTSGLDQTKNSRGELPLLFTQHETDSKHALQNFCKTIQPSHYNPAWMLMGDCTDLFYCEIHPEKELQVEKLSSGIHILENRPLNFISPKIEYLKPLCENALALTGDELFDFLSEILKSHHQPKALLNKQQPKHMPTRPLQLEAACVHAGPYGTRSSLIMVFPYDTQFKSNIWYTNGPPCQGEWQNAQSLWLA